MHGRRAEHGRTSRVATTWSSAVLAAVLVGAAATPAAAGDLWDGFESGSSQQWEVVQEGAASFTVTPDAARTGSFGARSVVEPWDPRARTYLRHRLAPSSEVLAKGAFRVVREGVAGSNVPTLRIFSGDRRLVDVYRQNVSGGLWVRYRNAGGQLAFLRLGTSYQPLDQWFDVAVRVEQGGDWSRLQVWVDGTLRIDRWVPLHPGSIDTVYVGAEHVRQVGVVDVNDLEIVAGPE